MQRAAGPHHVFAGDDVQRPRALLGPRFNAARQRRRDDFKHVWPYRRGDEVSADHFGDDVGAIRAHAADIVYGFAARLHVQNVNLVLALFAQRLNKFGVDVGEDDAITRPRQQRADKAASDVTCSKWLLAS